MPSTFGQDPNSKQNVKLGVVGVYVAPEDTAYNATGGVWSDLGLMDPGSFNCSFPKQYWTLEVGFPKAVKMKAVIATSGTMSFNLHEFTYAALDLVTGSGAAQLTYATAPAATTVASSPTVNGATLTSGTGYAAGQMVEVVVSSVKYYTYLDTVNGAVVTWKPALPVAPIATNTVKAVKQVQRALGTSVVNRQAFKAEFKDQYGECLTVYVPAMSCDDGFKPTFPDSDNGKLEVNLSAYGKDATYNGRTEQVIGYLIHDLANVT